MAFQANCSIIPPAAPSDAGIAGAGVLLSSTITSFLTLFLSASLLLTPGSLSSSLIRRRLISGYSDQQILIGIGIQSVGLVKASTLIPYHFFLIWMLSLLATATHNTTLLTLVADFKRDWVLRWLRQFLMFVNLVLGCTYGAFVLLSKIRGLPGTLPIACAWEWDGQSEVLPMDFVGTVAAMVGNGVVFAAATWYLHGRGERRKWYRWVQVGGLVLMLGVAIGATTRAFLLSQAFGKPDVVLSDEGERVWSFGQLLGLLMLLLPVVTVIEILRGEVKLVEENGEEGERKKLVGSV
ncbi:hypothetical protein OQA88_11522 [Cercophora sp. LCS_1]